MNLADAVRSGRNLADRAIAALNVGPGVPGPSVRAELDRLEAVRDRLAKFESGDMETLREIAGGGACCKEHYEALQAMLQ